MDNGTIGWVELYAEDANKTADFYENVFGWTIQRDPNMPDYVMFSTGPALGGGFTKNMPKAGGQMYIMTEDLDQSLKAVNAAGGKTVTEKTVISDEIGWWGQFSDPSGNLMGLFQQASHAH